MKKSVSRKMKHLAAKLCPRCSLTLQRNIHTPPKYRHVKNTMVQRLSETMVTMSKWRLAIAHTHYSVTCPRRRVMLLSKPPLKRTPYPFYSVICKDRLGCVDVMYLEILWVDVKAWCSAGRGWKEKKKESGPSLSWSDHQSSTPCGYLTVTK